MYALKLTGRPHLAQNEVLVYFIINLEWHICTNCYFDDEQETAKDDEKAIHTGKISNEIQIIICIFKKLWLIQNLSSADVR